MRITLNLDKELLELVRQYAGIRHLAIEEAVSEVIRRGLTSPLPTRVVNGFVVFDLPPDSPPISTEHVTKLAEVE